MVNKEQIGTVHYSKILDRNVEIKEGPLDSYYELIGLSSVLETKEVKDKTKMTFPKQYDSDSKS